MYLLLVYYRVNIDIARSDLIILNHFLNPITAFLHILTLNVKTDLLIIKNQLFISYNFVTLRNNTCINIYVFQVLLYFIMLMQLLCYQTFYIYHLLINICFTLQNKKP